MIMKTQGRTPQGLLEMVSGFAITGALWEIDALAAVPST
jgi:hypothetical protein